MVTNFHKVTSVDKLLLKCEQSLPKVKFRFLKIYYLCSPISMDS